MTLRNRLRSLERELGDELMCTLCKGKPPWFTPSYNYGDPVPEPTPEQCCPRCGKVRTIAICYKEESSIRSFRGDPTAAELRERMQ